MKALLDRVDYFINITYLGMKETHDLLTLKYADRHVDDLRQLAEPILTSDKMVEIWSDVERVNLSDEVFLKLSLIGMLLRRCLRADRSVTSVRFRMSCEGCSYNGDICSHLERPVGHRWIESSIKLAKAYAWIDGREYVTFEDVLWSLSFTLAHRLELKQSVFTKYMNETEWVKSRFEETLKSKEPIWSEAVKLFQVAQNGDSDAAEKLLELGHQCLAVQSLYEWALSGKDKPNVKVDTF